MNFSSCLVPFLTAQSQCSREPKRAFVRLGQSWHSRETPQPHEAQPQSWMSEGPKVTQLDDARKAKRIPRSGEGPGEEAEQIGNPGCGHHKHKADVIQCQGHR